MQEILAESFVEYVKEEKFIEARRVLDDIDVLATVSGKLKCPQ